MTQKTVRVYRVRAYRKKIHEDDELDPKDPENWITVKSTRVMRDPDTGELQGEVGKKIEGESGCKDYVRHPSEDEILDSLKGFSDADKQEFLSIVGEWTTSLGCYKMRTNPTSDEALLFDRAIENSTEKWSNGTLYRGISISPLEAEKYAVGGEFHQKGLSSWSTDMEVADSFSVPFDDDYISVVLIEDSTPVKNALSTANIGGLSKEQEVVYHSNTAYEIVEINTVTRSSDDEEVMHIRVKEIPKSS